jgi:uncharacterized SAM-binding protein YcdF (DUF218 family)
MYRTLLELAQPTVWLPLLLALALANLWRKRQEGRRRLLLPTILFALLWLACTPLVSYLAVGSLEWSYPPLRERPADIDAIVVLSGYVYVPETEGARPELGTSTLSRCLRAAEVYRVGRRCPVVVSGGKVDPSSPGPAFAESMRDFLVQLGVPETDLVVEGRSRNTFENAVETSRLLEERGLHRIVLITDAAHLKRATGCFRKRGIDVVPCGCRYRARRMEWSLSAFLPDPRSAEDSLEAWHEWLGFAWYALRGQL